MNSLESDIDIDVEEKNFGSDSDSYVLWFRVAGDNKYIEDVAYSSNSIVSIGNPFKLLNPFYLIWRIFNSKAEDEVKGAAGYNAVNGNREIDILIHPEYSIVLKDFLIFKKLYAEVTAFKGSFTKIE